MPFGKGGVGDEAFGIGAVDVGKHVLRVFFGLAKTGNKNNFATIGRDDKQVTERIRDSGDVFLRRGQINGDQFGAVIVNKGESVLVVIKSKKRIFVEPTGRLVNGGELFGSQV